MEEDQDGIRLLSHRYDEDFIEKTRDALTLIKTHDPLNYRRVTRFLRMITDLGFGESYYDPRYHACHVDQLELRKESIPHYAAGLIHEAVHGRLERCQIPYQGNEARHENLCKQVQVRFLERIGEQRLANIVRSTEDWWSDETVHERRTMFLEAMRDEYKAHGTVPDQCLGRFYGMLARRSRQQGQIPKLKLLRQYKQDHLDVLEFDRDGDGKVDQWEYYDEGVITMVEMSIRRDDLVDQRHIYVNGLLSRIEKLGPDRAVTNIGYVTYYKQGTQKKIGAVPQENRCRPK